MFYVYKWFNVETNDIFYIGKGCKKRMYSLRSRNKIFRDYVENNNCKCEIIQNFENEEDALKFENTMILQHKAKGQCICNLDNGGTGGKNIIWTDEMRNYKSINNPMKSEKQRKRMSEKNPMKNPEIQKKVADKIRKIPIIDGVEYKSVQEAAKSSGVCKETIWKWCQRGYSTDFKPCHYKGEKQKAFNTTRTNSKAVIIDGKHFNSVKEAAIYHNCWSESIIRCIKKNKLFKGMYCEYDNQQPSYEKSK